MRNRLFRSGCFRFGFRFGETDLAQALGTYDLADGASAFGERVTLYVGEGNDCGTLAAGEYLDYNGRRYALENNNGTLALKIS